YPFTMRVRSSPQDLAPLPPRADRTYAVSRAGRSLPRPARSLVFVRRERKSDWDCNGDARKHINISCLETGTRLIHGGNGRLGLRFGVVELSFLQAKPPRESVGGFLFGWVDMGTKRRLERDQAFKSQKLAKT